MILQIFDIRQGRLQRLNYFLLNISLGLAMVPIVFFYGTHLIVNPVLFFLLSITIIYMKTVFDVKRLRDMAWNPWIASIGVILSLPMFIFFFTGMSDQNLILFFEFMEKNSAAMTTIAKILNVV